MGLELKAVVGVDGAGFESGMKRLEGAAEKFTDTIKGFVIGAVGIASMEAAISKTVETARELVETSERLSIAPEQLQVLREAAKQAGRELGDLAAAFEKINIARSKALAPGAEGHDLRVAFGRAGVNASMLNNPNLTAASLFMGPLSQFARNNNAADVDPVLRQIGKGFGELMPVLKTDFEALEKKMRTFGGIMDTDTAVKLATFSKELGLVGQILTGVLGKALVSLAETIYVATLKIIGGISAMTSFIAGATAKVGLKDVGNIALGLATFNPQFIKDVFGKVDIGAGKTAAVNTKESFDARIDKFEDLLKKLDEFAKELNNPKAPNFTNPTDKLSKRALETPSDSLTRVGNFLGGFGLANADQQKIKLLTQIATNTKASTKGYTVDPYGLNSLINPNNTSFPGSPG